LQQADGYQVGSFDQSEGMGANTMKGMTGAVSGFIDIAILN
jgi:hypothetical protein